ncbi:uncharacterized protein LOC101167588 isoform X2 [Oryzias latipes]|uniref:uncharacterized protein LOC101167588 isoform X2 n=1 Tax=Oryzias latipes TaxID=8090 RepID=UPI0005CC6BBC|nr:uncharacterized protein LOC101167588 isoform X2 [Oryzias latipes]
MGQLLSSAEELSQLKDALASVLYEAMLGAGAGPDLRVVHPLMLANQDECFASQVGLMEQLQQLQGTVEQRAPTYLKDLIGRLSTFSDEPRLAGLLGLVIAMVMDIVYTTSKQSSGGKGKPVGSSSSQRIWELQEVMEEHLKRCRINLTDKNRLIQDFLRLEAQFSLILTQLKTCLLGGDCSSSSLRHWASGAIFHTQMLIHLARLEGKAEPFSARAALEQYREDLAQIIPAYRRYKSRTISVIKCRGGLVAQSDSPCEVPEEGAMTGLTMVDKETGSSVTIPLSLLEAKTGQRSSPDQISTTASPQVNLDLITSDQYAQAYLDRLFSAGGPVSELEDFFAKACAKLQSTELVCKQAEGVPPKGNAEGRSEKQQVNVMKVENTEESSQTNTSLKLSIVETQPQQSLHHDSACA